MNQKGQLILILILVMTVGLSIGLSIVQRSLIDISTSSRVEQASRAFSAAEAGVEKALRGDTTLQTFSDNNSSISQLQDSGLLPAVATAPSPQSALEFPPLAKEDIAQVWLADLNSASNPPTVSYAQPTLSIFWGNPLATDKPAIEVTLIYYNGSIYTSRKWYLDNPLAPRNPPNGFDTSSGCAGIAGSYTAGINTYQCRKTLGDTTGTNNGPLPSGSPNILVLLRVRLLYNTTSQPFAIQASGTCGAACSLPPQARMIISTGISGDTQRKIQLLQQNKVVPTFFDYAIFSAGAITK